MKWHLSLVKKVCFPVVMWSAVVCWGCHHGTRKFQDELSVTLAHASQGMVRSAELIGAVNGGLSYRERDPNPNGYVGSMLFERYCVRCHGTGRGPNILGGRATEMDAESDYYIIRYGLYEMQGFRSQLTKFQILDILAYMGVDLSNFTPSESRSKFRVFKKHRGSSHAPTEVTNEDGLLDGEKE